MAKTRGVAQELELHQLELKERQSRIGRSNVRRSKAHERRIAHLLQDWSGREFRRRRVEGRDLTVIERESTADVIAVRDTPCFSIEAKCGQMGSLDALLANPCGALLTEWWHQSCYDAQLLTQALQRRYYPLMFFKPGPNFDWVAVSLAAFVEVLLPREEELAARLRASRLAGLASLDRGVHFPVWFPHLLFDAFKFTGAISCNVVRTKRAENRKFVPLALDPMVLCRWRDFAQAVLPDSFFYPPQS